jgi:DNA mismatch repair protein MutL
VLQVVQRAALANPAIRISLRESGRELLDLPPADGLLERIRQVYGSEFADTLLPVAAARGEVSVTGFVSHPASGVRRARRNAFAVNGRPFESFEIRRLLSTTFAPLLTGGRHVEAVLRVHLPRRDVDANVSPEKSQVRFRRPGQVLAAVSDALRGALGEEEALVRLASSAAGEEVRHPWAGGGPFERRTAAVADPGVWEALFARASGDAAGGAVLRPRHGIPARPPWVVQLCDSFLLCPTDAGLIIVDQHSAHERVHYERLRERVRRLGRNGEVQSLIFPEVINLDPQRAALLAEMQPFLHRLGFDLTAGGPHTHLVQSIPAALGDQSAQRALQELMDVYSDSRELGVRSAEIGVGITPLEERMLKTVACHAAVKAGQPLTEGEIRALWSSLVQVELAGHDVHGRPAVLLLESTEIARRLGRG